MKKLGVRSGEFEGMADTEEGQTVRLYGNNCNHGDIFADDSVKYAADFSNDLKSSGRGGTITAGNNPFGF